METPTLVCMTNHCLKKAVETILAAGLPHAELVLALRLALLCNDSPDQRAVVTSEILDRWNLSLKPAKWVLKSLVINELLMIEDSRDLPREHRDAMRRFEYTIRWIASDEGDTDV